MRSSPPVRARRRALLAAAVLAAGATWAGGCGEPHARSGPGVLVLAVDGLRADHLSCLGYDRATTPELDDLAAGGVLFADTWSAAPLHIPAHAALLTGSWPSVARRIVPPGVTLPEPLRWGLAPGIARLAVPFLAHGFATAAFLDTPSLRADGGFGAGFQVYEPLETTRARPEGERGMDLQSARLRRWLASLEPGRAWLAYVHVRDLERAWGRAPAVGGPRFEPRPELDFVPPVAAEGGALLAVSRSRWDGGSTTLGEYEQRYDAELAELDGAVGTLLRSLDVAGRLEDTTVCVVGTYGVQFGEGGLYLESGLFSAADLHVPWIVRPAASLSARAAGLRVEHLASTVDVAPTLLELCGLARPASMHGRSHAAAVLGAPGPPVREHAFASCGRFPGSAAVGARWVYEELDLSGEEAARAWFGGPAAPEELRRVSVWDRTAARAAPLAGDSSGGAPAAVAADLREVYETWRGNVYATWAFFQGPLFMRVARDETVLRHLREIGYLGDGS